MSTENLSEKELTAFEDIKKIQAEQTLAKTFSQPTTPTSGIAPYNLAEPAKLLYPITTPIRNIIPRTKHLGSGIAANWRAFQSLNPTGLTGVNAEGVRGAALTDIVVDKTAGFKQIGLENNSTFEGYFASRGFGGEDTLSYMTLRTLQSVMEVEEKVIIGANNSVALGTTPTPTLVDVTTGGSLLASTAYRVICVALTYEGYLSSSLTSGVVGQVTQSNVDGSTTVYGGGSAAISAAATITTSAAPAHSINASVAVVNGAIAYAWYLGTTAGTERLAAITTNNSVTLTALNVSGQLASAIVNGTSDNSLNLTRYDGILSQVFDPASGSVIFTMPTGTLGQGTALTSDASGGIVEFDNVFESMWNQYRMSPTKIYINAREMKDVKTKILAAGGAPLFRFNLDGDKFNSFVGGSVVGQYTNMFTLGGGALVQIILHPFVAPGTVIFYCDNIQKSYSQSNVASPLEIECRQDYYQQMWPLRTKKFEYGVYVDSVLKNYFAPSFAVIRNIGTA